jgi:hypothetical protein
MMPTRRCDVLILVEDPGAANFVAELPHILAERGYTVHLASSGIATEYLARRGLAIDPLPPKCDLEALVARKAPRLVAVGTAEDPDSLGLRLVALAAARHLPSVGMLDASTNLVHRFRGGSGNPLQFCPDTVIVPDRASYDGLIALGLADHRIVVAGHPHWDYVRTSGRRLRTEDRAILRRAMFGMELRDRRVLVFAAEVSGGLDPQQFQRTSEYLLTGGGDSCGRTEIVIEEFLRALAPLRDRTFLVLRLHPKNTPSDFSPYLTAFDAVSKMEPSIELLHAADAVIGMTSMLMIEAALLNRPTLAILPRVEEAAWLPTATAGVTPYATSRADVERKLSDLLLSPRPQDPAMLERLFPPGALERVAMTIEERLRRGKAATPGARQ